MGKFRCPWGQACGPKERSDWAIQKCCFSLNAPIRKTVAQGQLSLGSCIRETMLGNVRDRDRLGKCLKRKPFPALIDYWPEAMGTYFSERNRNLDFYDKNLHFLVTGNYFYLTAIPTYYCELWTCFCRLDNRM